MSRPVVFLDRDGTIIEDTHYIRDVEKVALLPGAVDGLKEIQRKGYLLYIISNQSGLGRGIISAEQFKGVHERVARLLKDAEVEITEYLYCFHRPEDNCPCRKPRAGLLPRSVENVPIAFDKSFTVGDSRCDLELADHVSSNGCLVLTGKGKATLADLERQGIAEKYQAFADLPEFAASLPSLA